MEAWFYLSAFWAGCFGLLRTKAGFWLFGMFPEPYHLSTWREFGVLCFVSGCWLMTEQGIWGLLCFLTAEGCLLLWPGCCLKLITQNHKWLTLESRVHLKVTVGFIFYLCVIFTKYFQVHHAYTLLCNSHNDVGWSMSKYHVPIFIDVEAWNQTKSIT